MEYKRAERDKRLNASLEGYETYRKVIKAPVEVKDRAKELGLCVQDYISKLIIQDLNSRNNESI